MQFKINMHTHPHTHIKQFHMLSEHNENTEVYLEDHSGQKGFSLQSVMKSQKIAPTQVRNEKFLGPLSTMHFQCSVALKISHLG